MRVSQYQYLTIPLTFSTCNKIYSLTCNGQLTFEIYYRYYSFIISLETNKRALLKWNWKVILQKLQGFFSGKIQRFILKKEMISNICILIPQSTINFQHIMEQQYISFDIMKKETFYFAIYRNLYFTKIKYYNPPSDDRKLSCR